MNEGQPIAFILVAQLIGLSCAEDVTTPSSHGGMEQVDAGPDADAAPAVTCYCNWDAGSVPPPNSDCDGGGVVGGVPGYCGNGTWKCGVGKICGSPCPPGSLSCDTTDQYCCNPSTNPSCCDHTVPPSTSVTPCSRPCQP